MGRKSKKQGIYVYMWLSDFAVQQKRTQHCQATILQLKNKSHGRPWWFSDKEFAHYCRGHRFDPWSRMIPQAMEHLSLCTTINEPVLQSSWAPTTEPAYLEPMLRNKRSHCNEKPGRCNQGQPPLAATSKSLHAAVKTQQSQKMKKFMITETTVQGTLGA